jgi:isoleucyl-tRNA synthetase
VSDRIRLTVDGRDDVVGAAKAHESLLASETLALEIRYENADGGFTCKVGDGAEVVVRVEKIR